MMAPQQHPCVGFVPSVPTTHIVTTFTQTLLVPRLQQRLSQPCRKIMQIEKRVMKQMFQTTTQTAPSSGCATTTNLSSMVVGHQDDSKDDNTFVSVPVARHDEPTLYNIPAGLSPTYGDLPFWVGVLPLWITSFLLAAYSTFEKKLPWLLQLRTLALLRDAKQIRKLIACAAKTLVCAVFASMLVQEAWCAPSRITTSDLLARHFLPSSLSQYRRVSLPSLNKTLGVHFLEYTRSNQQQDRFVGTRRAAAVPIYVNHGFGASSLSWLPAIPALASRLNATRVVGHDACGFGFTERPAWKEAYTTTTSAEIAASLLQLKNDDSNERESPLLIGHSMGSFCTLQMAASIPDDVPISVVLVAPALGLPRSGRPVKTTTKSGILGSIAGRVFDTPTRYFLRRVVGRKGFWKSGLMLAWGDRQKVSDSDALRFQWPSIGLGWEQGLLEFGRAIGTRPDDSDLFRAVVNRKNCRILVIRGTRDRVISSETLGKFFSEFQDKVSIVELDGLGHDPFEEDVETFVDTVERWFK